MSLPVFAADEGSILRGSERSLEQIQRAYAEIPPVPYRPPAERWDKLPKTGKLLTEGGVLHVVMLGDSIVNDTSRSCWNFIVERRHPKCQIEKIACVRGSTGCWWYKYPGRVQKYVLDHNPDLVLLGGISHRNDIESIREVIRQIREESQPDILLMTGAFGQTDRRQDDQWQRISDPNRYREYRKGLEKLASEVGAAFLDMEAAWARYIRDCGKELGSFKRDPIHANAQGEQILGHILANYLSYPPAGRQSPADQETDPLVWDKLDRFQDWKLGFMMHWGIYSQWGCIESWPLVEAGQRRSHLWHPAYPAVQGRPGLPDEEGRQALRDLPGPRGAEHVARANPGSPDQGRQVGKAARIENRRRMDRHAGRSVGVYPARRSPVAAV
jgi:hypothetical protein